jgi:triacylglycerol esterase/lipase EstA (alpha/beta hydrolase family)
MTKIEWDRIPVVISFAEAKQMVETYGFAGSQGQTVLEGQRLVPREPSDTVFVFMHPATTLHLLPMPTALASAGLHVLCAGSRYAKNDAPLIMEKVAYDLGQYIKYARETLGYAKVVLVGWSGGGSLSLFYQGQAERRASRRPTASSSSRRI